MYIHVLPRQHCHIPLPEAIHYLADQSGGLSDTLIDNSGLHRSKSGSFGTHIVVRFSLDPNPVGATGGKGLGYLFFSPVYHWRSPKRGKGTS